MSDFFFFFMMWLSLAGSLIILGTLFDYQGRISALPVNQQGTGATQRHGLRPSGEPALS